MKLKVAHELSLPLEAVTQTVGIIAKKRAGKSYCARRFAEQLFKAGQQIVIVDPKGDWWGIRSSADGKSPGLPITIIGGEHGDLPLETNAGEVVAKLVVEERVSILLDLSIPRKHEVITFMTAFLESLYRLKAKEEFRTPVMLLIDEADAIAPQRPMKGEERMLGAAEDIVRRGGQRGIGCTMITQRSAVLNKNVLTQIQMLITLRTISPQDLAALESWIEVHGTKEERNKLFETIPSLPIGDAWFWSPGWPTENGIFERGHILPIETFDSGATPKPGQKRIEPKNLADVNLDTLKKQMAATVERAKENDPALLKKKIQELQKLVDKKTKMPAAVIDTKSADSLKEKLQASETQRLHYYKVIQNLQAAGKHQGLLLNKIRKILDSPVKITEEGFEIKVPLPEKSNLNKQQVQKVIERRRSTPITGNEDGSLSKPERAILSALATYGERNKNGLGILAGYSPSSGSFNNALSKLRTSGYINHGQPVQVTDEGLKALGEFDPLPSGEALHQYWYNKLSKPEATILAHLINCRESQTKQEISSEVGYSPDSGSFNNALSRLRTLQLIEGYGQMKAADSLFE